MAERRAFEGSLVAIVTPFRDGEVDLDAFGSLVEWHVASGTSGIVVSGTTGEAATLHPEEREALCRRAIAVARGRVPVIAGTGTNATWSTVQLTRAAAQWGVDAMLVVTPYYNKPTQEGLFLHCEAAARAASGRPVILYDVPGRTAVTFKEATVKRLARVPGVVALKDATGELERVKRLAPDLTVLAGDDAATLECMRRGATGVISVAANVVPEKMARLCRDRDERIHEELSPLFKALFVESNPIPVKFALHRMGRIKNELRLPLVPLSAEHEPTVADALRVAGAI
ncbi:MAG: 4-hydroxy-tetrahydrodipicolinate synthase [Planctomycetes bacterium]|nr:4-hydroxy-tetrahydrodipicolinate synthase [Planctomycetota bacterium]